MNEELKGDTLDRLLSRPAPDIADDGFTAAVVARIAASRRRADIRADWMSVFVDRVPWNHVATAVSLGVILFSDLVWPEDAALLLFLAGGCLLVPAHALAQRVCALCAGLARRT